MLKSMSIAEYAEQESRANRVHVNDGIWWREVKPLFCQPLHPLQKVPIGRKPGALQSMVGYQYILPNEGERNSFSTVMELGDIRTYSLKLLNSKKRNQVRRGLERVEIKEVTSVEDLLRDGFEVCRSFFERTKWGHKKQYLKFKYYRRWIEAVFPLPHHLTLGAYADGKMIAFIRGHAIEDVVCLSFIASHSQFLNLYPNEALIYSFIMKAKEIEGIKRGVYGIKSSKESLDKFKASLGFKPQQYPAFLRLNPMVNFYLKNFEKERYRRLFGSLEKQASRKEESK